MTEKQYGFALLEERNVRHFGGDYLKNSNPKKARPISVKRSMHLVVRSTHAKGSHSFLRKDTAIRAILKKQSHKFGVKIYRVANAGNHLHLVILPRSRKAFQGFIRAVTGLISRLILGVERGRGKGIQFWDKRPFTRIIEWGREYKSVCDYLLQNTLEALGFVPYKPRKQRKVDRAVL